MNKELITKTLNPKPSNLKPNRGIAAISSILAIITLVMLIGLAASTSGITEGLLSQTQKESQDAYLAAESGAQDAIMRVAKNKNYSSVGYNLPLGCSFNSATRCARVVVEKDAQVLCSQAISAGQTCVISKGTSENKSRRVDVILNVNATNGKLDIVSWTEI